MADLLEREDELARLDGLLAIAVSGSGACAVIEGPAGIGKTRLAYTLRDRARERGVRVLSARAGELETDFPYGVVRQLLDDAPEPGAAVFEALDALHRRTRDLLTDGPALMLVDDVQWCDPPSLRFLVYLQRRLEPLPLLVLLTARTGEQAADAHLLDQLTGDQSVTLIRPAPLSEEGARRLVREGCGEEAGARFVQACHGATGGNPFLLRALITTVAEEGIAPTDDNRDRVTRVGPRGVARSVLGRLRRLPEDAVALAQAIAVLGGASDVRVAAELAGLEPEAALAAADALARAEFIGADHPLAFVHPLIRTAIYSDLPAGERARRHGQAAELLEGDAAAAHLLETVPAARGETVGTLRESAQRALSRGATETAARYLRRAVLEPPDADEEPALLRALGEAEMLAGDSIVAVQHLTHALERKGDSDSRVETAILLRQAFIMNARTGDAVAALDRITAANDGVGARLEPATVGAILLDPQLARAERRRIDRLLEGAAAHGADGLAVCAGAVALRGGDADEAASLARRALEDPVIGGDPVAFYAGAFAVLALWLSERLEEATAACDRIRAQMQRHGALPQYLSVLSYRSRIALTAGRLADAEADARHVLEAAGLYGQTAYQWFTVANFVDVCVETGRLDEAEEVLARSDQAGERPMSFYSSVPALARARLDAARGRPREALDALLAFPAQYESDATRSPSLWPWRSEAARILVGLGEPERAADLAAEEAQLARAAGTPRALADALRVQATATGDRALLDRALEALAGVDAPLHEARVEVELGTLLRHQRRPTEAREPLLRALAAADRAGAAPLAARARAELAATGMRSSRRRAGSDELTPSERRVAELAAAGRTNDEIAGELYLTRRTVETHLTHTYRKLGIKSRDALAHALSTGGG